MRRSLILMLAVSLCLGLAPAALAGIPNPRRPSTNLVVQNVGPGDATLNLVCATGPGSCATRPGA